MSDLVEFLRAQLDKDEAVTYNPAFMPVTGPGLSGLVKRGRAEVEAKRRLIAEVWDREEGFPTEHTPGNTAEAVLKLLALPYAGEPGYREEWRP